MKKTLCTNNYIVIKNFINYTDAIALSSEFKAHCEIHGIGGDPQSPNSYSEYNYVSFLELLCKKVNEISDIVEETVIPTYSYARVYLSNSILEKHTDRDACEVSVTVHLNGDSAWPIYIKTPSNEVACIDLNVGDAIIYNGIVAQHWRDKFCGTWYTQLFLHYVRSRGPCAYTYFDKKKKKEFKHNNIVDSKNESENKMYNRGQIMSFSERDNLNSWANWLFKTNNLITLSYGRYEKKLVKTDEQILQLAFEIKKRIEEREQLVLCENETIIGDFLAIIPTKGYIHKHRDPNNWNDKRFHVRFNVFISVPTGSKTYYDGIVVNSVEMSYVMCRSGVDYHWSDVNESDTPRVSLSFGYLLSPEKIDSLSKPEYGIYKSCYPLALDYPICYENLSIEERGEAGSNIFTVSNVINEYGCNKIINFFNGNTELWETDNNYSNVTCESFITTNNNKCNHIDDYIFKVIEELLKAFKLVYPWFLGIKDSGYRIRKITGGTNLHTDGVNSSIGKCKQNVRCLSIIIVLNDDYDGGIFNFHSQNIKLKVKKGEAILFPPYWTHPHSVTSVGEGQARYTINTWILEKFTD